MLEDTHSNYEAIRSGVLGETLSETLGETLRHSGLRREARGG